jgi:hypothetical protein
MKNFFINIVLGYVSAFVKSFESLDQFMQLIGEAFGPDGCIHYSDLSPSAQKALFGRVPILAKNHTDWPSRCTGFPAIRRPI